MPECCICSDGWNFASSFTLSILNFLGHPVHSRSVCVAAVWSAIFVARKLLEM